METVHEASNLLEAQMMKDLLRQQGISAHLLGEYLTGGVGELPAQGLLRLAVDESDAARARQLLHDWDREQPADAPAPLRAEARWPVFVAGVACGLLLGLALFSLR